MLPFVFRGSIKLPINIPRSMFDREIDYYGITSSKGLITDPGSLAATMKSFAKGRHEHQMFCLAVECYYQTCKCTNAFASSYSVLIPKDHELFGKVILPEEKKLFGKFLDMYFGLEYLDSGSSMVRSDGGTFLVYPKKV